MITLTIFFFTLPSYLRCAWAHPLCSDKTCNGGRDAEKKVSIEAIPIQVKDIVSVQIPEVLSDEAIQLLLCKKFESAKRLYNFKPQNI
jgi:hypothetical protein